MSVRFSVVIKSAARRCPTIFSSGVAVFSVLLVPIGLLLLVILVFKFIGGNNIVRFYLRAVEGKDQGQSAKTPAGGA